MYVDMCRYVDIDMCRYVDIDDDVVGGCRVWARLGPGEQGAASSGPGTGTQGNTVTPPEAAWEPIVMPSLTGHVGRVGAGIYNRTHICFVMPHGPCVDVSDLSIGLTIKSFGTISTEGRDRQLCENAIA